MRTAKIYVIRPSRPDDVPLVLVQLAGGGLKQLFVDASLAAHVARLADCVFLADEQASRVALENAALSRAEGLDAEEAFDHVDDVEVIEAETLREDAGAAVSVAESMKSICLSLIAVATSSCVSRLIRERWSAVYGLILPPPQERVSRVASLGQPSIQLDRSRIFLA